MCRKGFCESPGKNFWGNCFGKNPGKSIIAGVEIFASRISLMIKPSDEVRGELVSDFNADGIFNSREIPVE